jgi:hypothetical protein
MKEQPMRKLAIALAIVVIVIMARVAHAQRGTPGLAASRVRVEAELMRGAPYSADVISESTQVLSDGNRIVHRSTSRVYRDSEGRTRREEDRATGSAAISISDPVAGSSWILDADTRSARPMPLIFRANVNYGAELDRFVLSVNGQLSSFVARGGAGGWITGPGSNEPTVDEKLAARTIEGVRVEGVRRTMTIPVGAIGNERPIVVTSEEWTPDLKVLVLSESNDPRTGTSTYKLVNVKRGDPRPSLFQVPADYTIVQPGGRGEGRGARGGAPPR